MRWPTRSSTFRSMFNPRIFAPATLALALLSTTPAIAGDDLSKVSAADYHAAAYFKEALEHPNIAKLKSRQQQISAVAKDLKMKPKKLEEALDKVDSIGEPDQVAKKIEEIIKS